MKTQLTQQLFCALMLLTVHSLIQAHNKVVVIPLEEDSSTNSEITASKTIFITNGTYKGNLGGPSGADDKCQVEANESPNITGTYKAWLSTRFTNDIPNRASFMKHSLPYVNWDGTPVATNFDDFLDGQFEGIIKQLDEITSDQFITSWTGTSDAGVKELNNCGHFTSDSASSFGVVGFSGGGLSSDYPWSGTTTASCSIARTLYCFEQ